MIKEIGIYLLTCLFWTLATGLLAGGGMLGILLVGFFWGLLYFYWVLLFLAVLAKFLPKRIETTENQVLAFVAISMLLLLITLGLVGSKATGSHSMVIFPILAIVAFHSYRISKSSSK